MRVLIAGAGLAGLTLAQRLLAAGVDVGVHERDPDPFARRQGYRITLDRHGIDALRRSLPADLFELVLRTSGPPGGHFRFTNEHLRDAFVLSFAPDPLAERQVDRDVLRRILLTGLGDRVTFGSPVQAVLAGVGAPEMAFAGGAREGADVVVVADGIGSGLARDVFPDAAPVDTGRGGIYGRSPLRVDGRDVLPASLLDSGFLALLPTPGSAFFFTAMRFLERPADVFAAAVPDTVPPDTDSYIMWGLVLPPRELDAVHGAPSPHDLAAHARTAVSTAHPLIRSLVDTVDPATLLVSRFRAGVRPDGAAVPNVAVLGDAIHPMPPFGAHGGNTALRDAAVLGDHLLGVADPSNHDAVDAAVRGYHDTMAGYGFDAVDAAMTQMTRLSASHPLQRWILRRALPALHRRTVPGDTA